MQRSWFSMQHHLLQVKASPWSWWSKIFKSPLFVPFKQLTPSLYMLFFCDLVVDMKDQIWLENNHLSLINFNRLSFSWTKKYNKVVCISMFLLHSEIVGHYFWQNSIFWVFVKILLPILVNSLSGIRPKEFNRRRVRWPYRKTLTSE